MTKYVSWLRLSKDYVMWLGFKFRCVCHDVSTVFGYVGC